jgi:hypothetical protein
MAEQITVSKWWWLCVVESPSMQQNLIVSQFGEDEADVLCIALG